MLQARTQDQAAVETLMPELLHLHRLQGASELGPDHLGPPMRTKVVHQARDNLAKGLPIIIFAHGRLRSLRPTEVRLSAIPATF
jgi:hypothetical protein